MKNHRSPAGEGRKRPQLDIEIERLELDVQNPRLPEEAQGGSNDEVLRHLYDHFDLDELADSMTQNGYFDEEPLVAIPIDLPAGLKISAKSQHYIDFINSPTTRFTVVEGNRRLATAKLLLSAELRRLVGARSWKEPHETVASDLALLPVIVYPTRHEVLPYLGVRHIAGIKKWESYARARYIAEMLREGISVEEIQKQIGDRAGAVRLHALCYHLLRVAREELGINIKAATNDFSLLQLAIGQAPVKHFLGWVKPDPKREGQIKSLSLAEVDLDDPVGEPYQQNLADLLSFLYGDARGKSKVITESRDITKKLCPVLANSMATQSLREHRNLEAAYVISDGEETMMKRSLILASSHLQSALGVAHRNRTPDIVNEAEKCADTAQRVYKAVTE